MKLPRPHYIPNDKLSDWHRRCIPNLGKIKKNKVYSKVERVKWYCPEYDKNDPENSWEIATSNKDICPSCGGFLGEKSHREFQLEMTGEDSYGKYNICPTLTNSY